MVRYSPAQLKTLARIKFNGLVYYYSGTFPMTYLNTPAPFSVRLHSATVRRLERDGLVEQVEDDDLGVAWRASAAGERLLRENSEYLAEAGQEAAWFEGQHALRQLGFVGKRAGKK